MDKLSLDKKKRLKRAFERKFKNINDMKILNITNRTENNEVYNISKCNLLQEILNLYKITKNTNRHYSPILNVRMNTRKGREKFKNFQILLDSGCSSTILMIRIMAIFNPKKNL